jgi:hypothetical protein
MQENSKDQLALFVREKGLHDMHLTDRHRRLWASIQKKKPVDRGYPLKKLTEFQSNLAA